VKQIRKRLTYANVMSSLAVFLVLGGATAFAAVQLGKNTVGTKQLKKNAVTAAKIKNGSVTNAKIQNNAVTSAKIADSAVGTSELANDAVTGAKIAEGSVGTGKLAAEAVTTGKIANDAVTGAKVNEDSLNGVVKNVTFESKSSSGDSTDSKIVTVDCGPGRKVIGGFYEAFDFGEDVKVTVHIMRRTSIGGEDNRGLQVFAEEITPDADIWQVAASATCATL
jgi:cytoskeletal protein RodZ